MLEDNNLKQANHFDVLDSPLQSPNANPIDNFWALVTFKLCEKKMRNVKQLFRKILLMWESCPEGARQIIDSEGNWTTY